MAATLDAAPAGMHISILMQARPAHRRPPPCPPSLRHTSLPRTSSYTEPQDARTAQAPGWPHAVTAPPPRPQAPAVPQIRQHAHRIKGAAGNLGMKALQETCALLEHNAKVRFPPRVHLTCI